MSLELIKIVIYRLYICFGPHEICRQISEIEHLFQIILQMHRASLVIIFLKYSMLVFLELFL